MHAAIRRYQIDPDQMSAAIKYILENFVPVIKRTQGLLAYYVLDAGDGTIVTITICENPAGVEQSNKLATEGIRQFLMSRITSEEEVPDLLLRVEEPFQGSLYEGVSEPVYKQSLHLLSVPEVGALLGMGRSWVYQQIRTGEIPSVQLGGTVKVKRQDLEEYVEKHRHSQWGEE